MDENLDSGIPAANLGDTDLDSVARTNPEAAKEIARLRDLMDRGDETKEEFHRLCKLLVDVGCSTASEYLLRRNLDYYEGYPLYVQLFGTAKEDEFDFAIRAFKAQFDLELSLVAEKSFIVRRFRARGGPPRSDAFGLLGNPCEIQFGYIEQETIEADVALMAPGRDILAADECLLLSFVNGVWEIAR